MFGEKLEEKMTRNQPQSLTLKAPLSGILVPIELVPDLVFAQEIVGDGISIDPVDPTLKAATGSVTSDGYIVLEIQLAEAAVAGADRGGISACMCAILSREFPPGTCDPVLMAHYRMSVFPNAGRIETTNER